MDAHQASSDFGDERAGKDGASSKDSRSKEQMSLDGETSVEADSAHPGALEEELEFAEAFDLPVEEIVIESDEDVVVRERDEYLDTLRRLQAEFDNYRKRVARQQTESVTRATESLLERFLPVLDALDLALAHHENSTDEATADRQALTQIAALARDVLSKEGLERIEATGVVFDPNIHDAVMHLEREAGAEESGVIVSEVLRAGYLLKGKVVRPAMVQVRG